MKKPDLVLREVIVKNTRLWIADLEVSYADAFREYVNLKKSHLFQVRMCTEKEQLLRKAALGQKNHAFIPDEVFDLFIPFC